MAQLSSIIQFLDSLLQNNIYKDSAFNGLQVESGNNEIRTIGFAVDSGLSVLETAAKLGCQLLVVHHGLVWDKPQALIGPYAKKIELLFRSRCSLYASHLPLDGNKEVGNAFEFARFLSLEKIESYFDYNGQTIGARGILSKSKNLEYFEKLCRQIDGCCSILSLGFGKTEISKVAIVTGSGSFAITQSAKDGIDLFISGEPKQSVYHEAKELNINAIFAGHYASETFGVKAIMKRLSKDFDVKCEFICEPTGI